MTARTRYFVIVSLLVLAIGLGTGLVAYYTGFATNAFARRGGPEELQLLPNTAAVVAYADVHQVMTSDLRHRVRQAVPRSMEQDGQRQFQEATGINIETDIDRVVAAFEASGRGMPNSAVVIARGRFDETRIEALMRDHGAQVELYKGKRLILSDKVSDHGADAPDTAPDKPNVKRRSLSLAFVEPGLAAFGGSDLVRRAIDLHNGGGDSIVTNEELMNQVRTLESGNAWAVGRFDALRSNAKLPEAVTNQLPPITWFAVSGHVNGGLRGMVRAETRDDESANNLRDVVRGFLALAKMQAGSRPEFQALAQSLELGGTGQTVALSFDIPLQIFDAFAPK